MVTQSNQVSSTVAEGNTKLFSALTQKDINSLDALYNNEELPKDFRRLAYTCKLYARATSLMTQEFAVTNGGSIALNFQNKIFEQAEAELLQENT